MKDNDFLTVNRKDLELVLVHGFSTTESNFAWDRLRALLEEPPRCPGCGYTEQDCREQMDHHLCGLPEPATARPIRFADLPVVASLDDLSLGHQIELMRDALDHIAKTCHQSRQSTRRIRWIEARANSALEGKPYDEKLLDLPVEVDREIDRLKRRDARQIARIKELEALLLKAQPFTNDVAHDPVVWLEIEVVMNEQPASAKADQTSKTHLAAQLESLAKQVYQSWESQPGFVPWVDGGNSSKQNEARQIASRTFELALANQVGD